MGVKIVEVSFLFNQVKTSCIYTIMYILGTCVCCKAVRYGFIVHPEVEVSLMNMDHHQSII